MQKLQERKFQGTQPTFLEQVDCEFSNGNEVLMIWTSWRNLAKNSMYVVCYFISVSWLRSTVLKRLSDFAFVCSSILELDF